MLKTVLDVVLPVLTFLLMTVVGLELTATDFRRVVRRFWVVALATTAQILLWPLAALALVAALPLKPYIATGILLVAVCPSGNMANLYAFLGRANLALSVTLTAVSCLAAVVTMPVLLALLRGPFGNPAALDIPVPQMIGQLLLLLVLPVLTGVLIRRTWPWIVGKYGRWLLRVGVLALAALIGLVVVQEWGRLLEDFTEILLAVSLLTVIMLTVGWCSGWACALGADDRFSLAMVLVVRNVGIATVVSVTLLGRLEFAVFATAYFLNQVPILVTALLLFRLTRSTTLNGQVEANPS